MQINGWILWAHPAFNEPLLNLVTEVESLQRKDPKGFRDNPKTKLLARIQASILEEIPANPQSPEFEQGNTLGKSQRHWKRAKFLGRFRLFFRFSSKHKAIIYAWVNDENTLRKAGAATDPYEAFKKRLLSGNPPSEWEELLAASQSLESIKATTRNKAKTKANVMSPHQSKERL